MSLLERLRSPGPKRILALDGGGIRGALTLGYLEKIEGILRERHNNPQLRLCEYFDLIGGTSTGSIIAAALAMGKSVAEVKQLYLELGGTVFTKNWLWQRVWAIFSAKYLRLELEKVFGDLTLGSSEIKTGLAIFSKRVDTGSTWSLTNHPDGVFHQQNENILLRRLIRASTAAPVFFESETIDIGDGQQGEFIDGGVSMVNNPALMMFMMASLKGFPFHWETGEDKLLLVSVGTGTWRLRKKVDAITGGLVTTWAKSIPSMLMYDASEQNQLILQFLSRSQTPWTINSEVADLADDLLPAKPLLTYLRYNMYLDENGLNELGLVKMISGLSALRNMSAGESRFDLATIGEKSAEVMVRAEHFPPVFNVTSS